MRIEIVDYYYVDLGCLIAFWIASLALVAFRENMMSFDLLRHLGMMQVLMYFLHRSCMQQKKGP
ncbi:MAG: hypothetical protein CMQ33_10965 [Gammaproteobacteria bacterium]|nr:hypothetical protein [Gammaproteobacteria bacterium]